MASSADNASPVMVGRFPSEFNVYYTKTSGVTNAYFHLGEHKDQPLFAATCHVGWNGKSDLTLHDGPDVNGPALATAESEKLLGMNSIIKILSPPADDTVKERLRVEFHLTGESHHFTIATGTGTSTLPEKFEWRQTRGDEVRASAGRSIAWGWKLVRLGTPDIDEEVVAVLADTTSVNTKVGKFQFLNSGAAGKLGDAWAIMAVTTGLRIWQMRWFLMSA